MLNQELLNNVKTYTDTISRAVTLVVAAGNHSKRAELVSFLQQISDLSDKIHLEERESPLLRSPLSFALEAEGDNTGVQFSGIPSGHEFNSFILALLYAGGRELKLDASVQSLVKTVTTPIHFEVFVSLSCHNCPDIVQALHQFSLLNPNISAEMIDGGLFPQLVEERELQGVPAVFANGQPFANGKTEISQLLDKLQQIAPEAKGSTNTVSTVMQDVVVIGGGPAGASAAIYSARKGLAVTLLAERLGGQVKDTQGIENLISVSHTTGSQLSGNLVDHMNSYPITVRENIRVESISGDQVRTITLNTGEQIQARSIIVATGAQWRKLGIPGEEENIGAGVAYCPHCDGPFFAGKDVVVVGGGNSGIEAALDLAGIVKSVTVVEFMPTLKADKVLIDQAHQRANISIITNAACQEIVADKGKVVALEYLDRAKSKRIRLNTDGVFVQIGLSPNSQFMADLVERTAHGEIMIDNKCRTTQANVFAAGDVTTVPYKQIVIAMGEGAKAALSAFEYLLANPAPQTELDQKAA
jgi:alkyl hydroperoxide reductase subunit F